MCAVPIGESGVGAERWRAESVGDVPWCVCRPGPRSEAKCEDDVAERSEQGGAAGGEGFLAGLPDGLTAVETG